jgi:hypothetical protein
MSACAKPPGGTAPALRRGAPLRLALLALACAACGDDSEPSATVVAPVYGDPCQFQDCGEHGECIAGDDGEPLCECELAYGGAECERCADGFHLDAKQRCAPDRSCADQEVNPCGAYGTCDDHLGVVSCVCDEGYEGPRCELCAQGHGRSTEGECLPSVLVMGGGQPGTAQPAPGEPDTEHPAPSEPGQGSGCLPTSCTSDSHGSCSVNAGVATCACNNGYAGDACERCADDYHGDPSGACVPDQTCTSATCSGHGQCSDTTGLTVCTCAPGYGGPACATCGPNFHSGPGGTCGPSEQCQPSSCPPHSTCDHSSGLVQCTCAEGYTGSLCEGCAAGFYRFYDTKTCERLDCSAGALAPGSQDFESLGTFPLKDTCQPDESVPVSTEALALRSYGGDGDAWACGPTGLFKVPLDPSKSWSNYVYVEAGANSPAQLVFAHPIASVRFDYAAVSDLNVDVLADGVVVQSVMALRRASGVGSYSFVAPITVLAFRHKATTTASIGFDNISWVPACP